MLILHVGYYRMGRKFESHYGGKKEYSCKVCKAYLTNQDNMISNKFQGASGKAFLFDKVCNIEEEEAVMRDMITGRHLVRDVLCKFCKAKLGWMYEIAYNHDQKYKEGKVILERAYIRDEPGCDDQFMIHDENPAYVRSAIPHSSINNFLGMSHKRELKAIMKLCGTPSERTIEAEREKKKGKNRKIKDHVMNTVEVERAQVEIVKKEDEGEEDDEEVIVVDEDNRIEVE